MRAKVTQGLLEVEPLKNAYADYISEKQAWPSSLSDLGLQDGANMHSKVIESLNIGTEHELRIRFNLPGRLDGKTLVLIPSQQGQEIHWKCSVVDLPNRFAPAQCRKTE